MSFVIRKGGGDGDGDGDGVGDGVGVGVCASDGRESLAAAIPATPMAGRTLTNERLSSPSGALVDTDFLTCDFCERVFFGFIPVS